MTVNQSFFYFKAVQMVQNFNSFILVIFILHLLLFCNIVCVVFMVCYATSISKTFLYSKRSIQISKWAFFFFFLLILLKLLQFIGNLLFFHFYRKLFFIIFFLLMVIKYSIQLPVCRLKGGWGWFTSSFILFVFVSCFFFSFRQIDYINLLFVFISLPNIQHLFSSTVACK